MMLRAAWETDLLSPIRLFLEFYLKLVKYPSNMEDGASATAICDAIKKIRKVLKKRPFEDNILKIAAKMSGLSRESLRRTLSSLVESGAIYISKTAEDKDSYYIFNVEEFGTEEDFGDISYYKDLNFDVDQVPEISQATTPPSRDMTGFEKTDFLVFLDLVSKLTDDIKYLQSKIDIINDKNEKLQAQNFELRLENIKLTSCVHTPPDSSFSTASKEAISRDTPPTQTAYGKRNGGKDNVCTIPVRADNIAEILEPTVTKREKKDKQKEGNSSIEREECMFSLNGTGGKSQSKETINSPINNYHEANSKDYNKLGNSMKTVPTNQWRKQRAYEETAFPSPSQTPSFAKRLPTNDENMIANNTNNQLQNKEGVVWPRNTILITGDSMLSNINERTLSDMFDYIKPLLKKRPEKIILVIGANDIKHKMYQEIIA